MDIKESIDLIQETIELYFEERNYLYYNFHTVLDNNGVSYEEYKKLCKDKAQEEIKTQTIDINEIKKENEDILKSFFEKRWVNEWCIYAPR